MAEEHAPSYYMKEGPELFGEDQWKSLGIDDLGPDVAYDEEYDFGADEDLAKVEDTEIKDPNSKAINQTSQEHPPSFYVQPSLVQVGEDQWDFLGTDFDPDLAYNKEFDFGTDKSPANVEPTASKGPDLKAMDREGIQEDINVAMKEKSSQNEGSPYIVSKPTGPDIRKALPEERADIHDNITQPAHDSEASTAVITPTVIDSKRLLQSHSSSIVPAQPSEDNRQKPEANAPGVAFGYDTAVIL